MSALESLKLTTAKKPTHVPAIVFRRNKLSSKLWEQIQLGVWAAETFQRASESRLT